MSAATPRTVAGYSTAQAGLRLWTIRHLLRERAIDPLAAAGAAECLERHANPRIKALATATRCDIADLCLRRQDRAEALA